VAPAAGVPTGTVTYYFNGRSFKTKTLSNGTAFIRVAPGKVFGKLVYVKYKGDSHFEPSVSASQVVTRRSLKHPAKTASTTAGAKPAHVEAQGHPHSAVARLLALLGRGGRQRHA
jgi:hypothetical protein